jgi:hypothetical protein
LHGAQRAPKKQSAATAADLKMNGAKLERAVE